MSGVGATPASLHLCPYRNEMGDCSKNVGESQAELLQILGDRLENAGGSLAELQQ